MGRRWRGSSTLAKAVQSHREHYRIKGGGGGGGGGGGRGGKEEEERDEEGRG